MPGGAAERCSHFTGRGKKTPWLQWFNLSRALILHIPGLACLSAPELRSLHPPPGAGGEGMGPVLIGSAVLQGGACGTARLTLLMKQPSATVCSLNQALMSWALSATVIFTATCVLPGKLSHSFTGVDSLSSLCIRYCRTYCILSQEEVLSRAGFGERGLLGSVGTTLA